MITKAELRRLVREKLAQLAPADFAEKSAGICKTIAHHAEWRRAKTVGLFAPHTHEPDIDPLWQHIQGKLVCYPRVVGETLSLLRVRNLSELKTSRWNLREPDHANENLLQLEQIDVLLVPGVAFSRNGERLGRGGGFYDRFLAEPKLRAFKIGVCFDAQLACEFPRESHDQAVDAVVTEFGVIRRLG